MTISYLVKYLKIKFTFFEKKKIVCRLPTVKAERPKRKLHIAILVMAWNTELVMKLRKMTICVIL